ncbi:hypothetical protein NEF87_002714 [Candidatus Lokiarchaeum ossiferum]|uniref:Bacterial type II secretion system protein E domain-containing protein n=1 Tax=Candidatus Lokiarchaeum ossiferum TaxID=2951803 RepID=A0ABY6HV47_9ARCH|nr:hypothetical protein NEF87_002714 [Candidatus Lokiarchaeum sp. B-35]
MKKCKNNLNSSLKNEMDQRILSLNCSSFPSDDKKLCLTCIVDKLLELSKKSYDDIQINWRVLDNSETKVLVYLSNFLIDLRKRDLSSNCKIALLQCQYNSKLINPLEKITIQSIFRCLKNENVPNSKDLHEEGYNLDKICESCIKKQYKKNKLINKIYCKSKFASLLEKKYGLFHPSLGDIVRILPSFSLISVENNLKSNSHIYSEIEQYSLHKNIFLVKIFKIENEIENLYQVTNLISPSLSQKLDFFKKFFKTKLSSLKFQYFSNLAEKIDHIEIQLKSSFKNFFPEIRVDEITKLSLILALKYLKVEKLFPLLVDPFIEEIFLDSAEAFIYLNHQKFGRCITKLCINEIEIEALKTHLRFESEKRLDEKSPSLIHSINNKYFHCRFSIDIFPSHWKNFSFDIRKMNKNIYSIIDLISLNTLSVRMASFLIFCIINRINITIAGEVNSGKTTLLNSIDLMIPKNFRKIYVEETLESLEIPISQNHQLKYVVESDLDGINRGKEKEIYKLLHRSGDIIILGEILNKSESDALFHCLSAGLKGIQTTHASSIQGLINRWIVHFNIDKSCFNDLGIIVLMKKIGQQRKILSICETIYNRREDSLHINDFFKYFPNSNKWKQIIPFTDSNLFKKLNSYLNLTDYKYQNIINTIEDALYQLIQKSKETKKSKFNLAQGILKSLNEIEPMIGGN